jgi:hypothetical protein
MKRRERQRQFWLITGGVVVTLLAAAVFTLGSLKIPLRPEEGNTFAIFFALSVFLVAAFFVFVLVLIRSLLRLGAERHSGQMGSRFKVKMVAGAMGISLLPVIFLFLSSYALVNRTLNIWFPRPLEIANEESQVLLTHFGQSELNRLNGLASQAALQKDAHEVFTVLNRAADASWLLESDGKVSQGVDFSKAPASNTANSGTSYFPIVPEPVRTLRSGAEVWKTRDQTYLAGSAPFHAGKLYVARHLPTDFLDHYQEIELQTRTYENERKDLRAYKRNIVLALSLITLLLLFATTWVALFLSKQVTVPIQALAEATHEISHGNFDHRISVQAQDELGMLVRSFNRMTAQLGEGRRQINEFTQSLELAIEEREQRRKLMETILENIPTGVVSLDSSGEISRVNSAAITILGEHARSAKTVQDLLGEEATRSVLHLMRRSLRMGAASREIEIATGGRLVRAAVTVSSLGPRRSNPGYVVVIDDLTDLLRAQRASAWQEVAQRIAHEIKNPLTPIQLSAQRLLRHLGRSSAGGSETPRSEFEKLAAECAGLIEREVRTLESLVDEFSQFARFPAARLAPADVNDIVESALDLFSGRLDGIILHAHLAASLPPVRADKELMRRVLANIIDNAAEALEGASVRELTVATRTESEGDAIAIEISDSGPGISPTDKEKLFLPHFSTKERGTGLGLAIASRIIAEHNGTIRAEDNHPSGTRFLIRFPAMEIAATPEQAGSPAAQG